MAPPPASIAWRRVIIRWMACTPVLGDEEVDLVGTGRAFGCRFLSCFRPGLRAVSAAVARSDPSDRSEEQRGGRAPAQPQLVAGGEAVQALVAGPALAGEDFLAGLQRRHDLEMVAHHHRGLARRGDAFAARVGVHLLGPQPDPHPLARLGVAHDAADPEARLTLDRHQVLALALECRLQVVHVADEVGDERGGGTVVDLRPARRAGRSGPRSSRRCDQPSTSPPPGRA